MSVVKLSFDVDLESHTCGKCGGVYALTTKYVSQKREKGGYWNCPYCQCSWGYGESEVDRLNKEIEAKDRRIKQEEMRTKTARTEAIFQKNRARAEKGAKTKIKKRVAHGVCPCCNRTFKQLAAHMKNQHPNYESKIGDK